MENRETHDERRTMKRLLISGTRTFTDKNFVWGHLHRIMHNYDEFVFGCAKGPDTFAREFAETVRMNYSLFEANWLGLGKKAGPERNQRMVDYCDESDDMLAFWDGKSPGTADCIKKANDKGMNVKVVRI